MARLASPVLEAAIMIDFKRVRWFGFRLAATRREASFAAWSKPQLARASK
jgi:hypothetical protein